MPRDNDSPNPAYFFFLLLLYARPNLKPLSGKPVASQGSDGAVSTSRLVDWLRGSKLSRLVNAQSKQWSYLAGLFLRSPMQLAKALSRVISFRVAPWKIVTECVRPLVWDDAEYPGFSGTCFLLDAFGKTYAFTARHALGGAPPSNLAISKTLKSGPVTLLMPSVTYWYNAGDYDHLADKAVAVFDSHISGALPLDIGFVTVEPGERLAIRGYPRSLSRVHYDIDGSELRALGLDAANMNCLFDWEQAVIMGRCLTPATPMNLGTIALDDSDQFDLDGMSGSPVFARREGKPKIAGMLVRGGNGHAHFISANSLMVRLAFCVAKDRGVVEMVIRLVESAIVGGDVAVGKNLLGASIVDCAVRDLRMLFNDDHHLISTVLQDWARGDKLLGNLILSRVSSVHLETIIGTDACEVLRATNSIR